jgi:hypothetical protein
MKNLISFGIISILLFSCGGGKTEKPKDEWYVGGTLHRSNLKTWSSSTEKNKLATCADFVANVKDYQGDMTKMKSDALEVLNCIEETAKEPKLSDQKTSEIAATCVLLLGITK